MEKELPLIEQRRINSAVVPPMACVIAACSAAGKSSPRGAEDGSPGRSAAESGVLVDFEFEARRDDRDSGGRILRASA
jgi:hypothetical protein